MPFVRIPAGEFIMGLPDEGENTDTPVTGVPPEAPPHPVQISRDFYLGIHEVTQAQYEKLMGTNPSWYSATGGGKTLVDGRDTATFPVEQVSWADAVAFCKQLSSLPEERIAGRTYRLPTEAEWEYACRSGSTRPFPRKEHVARDNESGYNVFVGEGRNHNPVKPIGSYQPNPFGLHDMRGNVWEWCSDWFGLDYYRHSPSVDPQGPGDGVFRVVRGADWRFSSIHCKLAYRFDTEPWQVDPHLGFRVACDLNTSK